MWQNLCFQASFFEDNGIALNYGAFVTVCWPFVKLLEKKTRSFIAAAHVDTFRTKCAVHKRVYKRRAVFIHT